MLSLLKLDRCEDGSDSGGDGVAWRDDGAGDLPLDLDRA